MASSVVKQELIDCGFISNTSINSNLLKFSVPHGANDVISVSMNTNSSPKMGSRRIFTPQFKLQVLESYRNDSDCKGNQRATARKYNIHRRQIQKWLQCESNLRSSVANINQSNVKHQFHNICHNHHCHNHQQKQNITITTRNKHNTYGHNPRPLHHQLSLDTARERVDLNLPAEPSLVLQNTSTISTPDVSVMSNLAPVVENSADAMILVPTQASSGKSTAISLVRPTAIGGSGNGTIHKSMLHTYHHYDQYSMPYTHTPASIPVSVPTVTHNSPPQLLNHYQYQNQTHHSNSLTHDQQSSLYLPSTSLPVIVLSTAASSVTTAKNEIERVKTTAIQRDEIKKCDELRPSKCAATTILTQPTGNEEYVHKSYEYIKNECMKDVNKIDRPCELQKQTFSLHPIDLSLGQKHRLGENITAIKSYSDNYEPFLIDVGHSQPPEKHDLVVDLTFRKRKGFSNAVVNKQREKKAKKTDSEIFSGNNHEMKDEELKDVEVGLRQKTSTPKPVKLFKPYLLHTEDKIKPVKDNETCNPIMWSHHPDCLCPNSYDKCEYSHQNSFFQSPLIEKYSFHGESFNLYTNKITFNQSSLSPQSPSQLSSEGLRCPKGSPVSGYESSSSTYSDLSFKEPSRKNYSTKAYSIDVEFHPIFKNNLIFNENNIKKWLDQEYTNSSRSPSPSIAVYI